MKAQRSNWFVFNEEFHQKIKVDGGRFNKFDLKAEFTLQFHEIYYLWFIKSLHLFSNGFQRALMLKLYNSTL